MKIELASSYGFCFGVKRAIEIAEKYENSATMGPLIHNDDEINRLKKDFKVGLYSKLSDVKPDDTVIIRTHGIPKNDLRDLRKSSKKVINATCPFVTTPQNIVKNMSKEGYSILIFGDTEHPEVKGVMSYAEDLDDVNVILSIEDLEKINFKNKKIATVAQTTKKKETYLEIVNALILKNKEVRVFNTICDATFENQDAARDISIKSDVMIVIGGKNSSNTKQLHSICLENCKDSYLIENENELKKEWFKEKEFCGITAGASTPDWVIQKVIDKIKSL
ncbi:4-hydroxy-3-methylbut-2-enyl diphosphate reductase [Aliarcobacter thereius]|uniref:4-hydroxy-3-methylbut-2-enyl diphosphate reductase n=2 Tax=Aliarcobacter thereius TaxID=544718 RepID=A0A1C0B9F3_9BACT|nr:4-hydroxy-3-methylbut-2-enyl diphosphate reductase [Aliarcobacter thereius]OCL88649.1 4-hydroxy-3-methylbut-2-enyl diphosphate reductase [Aliarcobacter thereius]OCL92144.1 4-hydroxy-3-methylbut-2-enyl diphosphate reductase [Aliarcobacter thereius]OCL94760.1 4-hydroxy-3-methylbut-2-enyl diphosphate reductase [Aliarcobacter thereius LMG 24486]OCM00208.1 4-hydroxy-3-methylbut-2-enyl diphosphate reductase [Aliarcobacter thereius]QBF15364.1 1-hydroxy-2-methyl-2-(E)-butenyl 4-diphosphate reductas